MPVVNDYTALISGYSWSGSNSETNAPIFVTYSFDTALPDFYDTSVATQALLNSFDAFSNAEKNTARAALQQWGDACGIVFLEVENSRGDIAFGNYDFSLDPEYDEFSGFAYYANTSIQDFGSNGYAYRDALGGDVFINQGDATSEYLLLHEIGHALGLKHPFEGPNTLATALDNHTNTVMSYTGTYPEVLGGFDLQAAVHLYGVDADDGEQVFDWSWDSVTETLEQRGFNTDDLVYGTGTQDLIYGRNGDDALAGFQSDDIIYGGNDNDLLFGNEGDDTLYGQADDDNLSGGEGDDTLNGSDGVDEFNGGAGRDKLVSKLDGDADAFVFYINEDADTITNYEQGIDYIWIDDQLLDSGVNTAAEILSNYGSINAAGTQITLNFGGGDVLRIKNSAGDLDFNTFENELFIL